MVCPMISAASFYKIAGDFKGDGLAGSHYHSDIVSGGLSFSGQNRRKGFLIQLKRRQREKYHFTKKFFFLSQTPVCYSKSILL